MNVADSIIKTLAFFNLFNHPLTNFELYQLLYTQEPVDFFTVLKEAESLKLKIQEQDGFFFLSPLSSFDGGGEESISPPIRGRLRGGLLPVEAIQEQGPHLTSPNRGGIKRRQERAISHDKKFRIAQKAARLISWVPFVKLAAVCNTLSFGAAEEKSDIDFFIIVKKGRIWTVRFFVTAILSFFGLRRHGQKIKNRICLSFYLADENLDLQSIALPTQTPPAPPGRGGNEFDSPPNRGSQRGSDNDVPDIYLIYWITQLVPLINRGQTLEKFWQANFWVKNYLANYFLASQLPDYHQIKIPRWVEGWRRLHERLMAGRLGDWRERFFKWLQLKKMAKNLSCCRSEGDTAVVISDQMLKFHEEDRREELRGRWRKKLSTPSS